MDGGGELAVLHGRIHVVEEGEPGIEGSGGGGHFPDAGLGEVGVFGNGSTFSAFAAGEAEDVDGDVFERR